MIPHQHLWQSHSGAAHRKKIDTPSLGWACFRGTSSRMRTTEEETIYTPEVPSWELVVLN